MTPSPGRMGSALSKLLVGAAVGIALLLLLRAFAGDVYRVETGSMRPTLQAGDGEREHVLVTFAVPRPLERFALVVVREHPGAPALVKRLIGLPGEEVLLRDGDLWIDGRRLAPDARRPAPVPVFDARLHPLDEYFFQSPGSRASWRLEGSRAELDALELVPGEDREAGLLAFHKPLLDDRLAADGQRVPGRFHVGDALLELDLEPTTLAAGGGALRLRLVERGDLFEFVLELPGDALGGSARARLERRGEPRAAPWETLVEQPFEWRPGKRLRLAFANLDNRLVAAAPELGLRLAWDYRENRPRANATAGEAPSPNPRVAFGGEGLRAVFHGLRIHRDLAWLDRGRYGVERPLRLGPDEVFVLGDDSASSRDSRQFGPLPTAALVGRPRAVVWPPARARRLGEPASGWP